MYEPGKILYAGGGGHTGWGQSPDPDATAPTATAEIIDLNQASPTWQNTSPMSAAAAASELHDPAGRPGARHRRHQRWWLRQHQRGPCHEGGRGLESGYRAMDHPRQQQRHAGLPLGLDAPARRHGAARRQRERAGHAAWRWHCRSPGSRRATRYSRRRTSSRARAPRSLPPRRWWDTEQTFAVATPNAAQVTEVRWIRLGSVTHAFDMSQRANNLTFARTSTGVDVTAPANGNLAPPGHYQLFILNRNGVPSAGKVVRIE